MSVEKARPPVGPLSVYEALERLVAELETNSEAGAPDYAFDALKAADDEAQQSVSVQTHVYQGRKTEDQGRCDDAYCTGHTSSTVHCSCGWHEKSYSDWDTAWKDDIAWLHHVVSVTTLAIQSPTHTTRRTSDGCPGKHRRGGRRFRWRR